MPTSRFVTILVVKVQKWRCNIQNRPQDVFSSLYLYVSRESPVCPYNVRNNARQDSAELRPYVRVPSPVHGGAQHILRLGGLHVP